MRNYRDLQVWKKAHDLTLELYRVSQRFLKEEIYGVTGPAAARSGDELGRTSAALIEVRKMLTSFLNSVEEQIETQSRAAGTS